MDNEKPDFCVYCGEKVNVLKFIDRGIYDTKTGQKKYKIRIRCTDFETYEKEYYSHVFHFLSDYNNPHSQYSLKGSFYLSDAKRVSDDIFPIDSLDDQQSRYRRVRTGRCAYCGAVLLECGCGQKQEEEIIERVS